MSEIRRRPTGRPKRFSRRQFGLGVAASAGGLGVASGLLAREFGPRRALAMEASADEWVERVTPTAGIQTRTRLGDSAIKLVKHGIIDRVRFMDAYPDRLPPEQRLLLFWPSHRPIKLTRENAGIYVNLLWPIGFANRLGANENSPINGDALPTFASTAGWTLGREENGAAYFNRYRVLDLTAQQEELAVSVAKRTYRPCCDNSTFFQDCNHGSALFGLLQLGAAQGLREAELFHEALTFNSFWFPSHYVQIALYLELIEKRDWAEADPVQLMGPEYSASSLSRHKLSQIAQAPGSPLLQDAVNC